MGAGLNAGEDERLERERKQEEQEILKKKKTPTIKEPPTLQPIKTCTSCGCDMRYQPWSMQCQNCLHKYRLF